MSQFNTSQYRDRLYYSLDVFKYLYPSQENMAAQGNTSYDDMPTISICIAPDKLQNNGLTPAVEGILAQTCDRWQLCICTESHIGYGNLKHEFQEANLPSANLVTVAVDHSSKTERFNIAASMATGDYLMFLEADTAPFPTMVFEVLNFLKCHPASLCYGDSLAKTLDGKIKSQFKPDYAPEYFHAFDYIGESFAISKTLFDSLGRFNAYYQVAQRYNLLVKAADTCTPLHLEKMLLLSHESATDSGDAMSNENRLTLDEYCDKLSVTSSVHVGLRPNTFHIVHHLQDNPLVSIIIPNKDHADDLETLLVGIAGKTAYRNIEILIIENSSEEEETFGFYEAAKERFQDLNLRVIEYNHRFNYSSIINAGCAAARGDFYLMLNNDTQIIEDSWLSEMLSCCMLPNIGIVGPMLLYTDGTIQHAGINIAPNGDAWHVYRGYPQEIAGYMNRVATVQNYSAITGACMLVPASVFEVVRGFDEDFAVNYNDIDFCYRVAALGYRIVWTPFARLIHAEGKTRGFEITPEKQAQVDRERLLFINAHTHELERDKYYNSSLKPGGFYLYNIERDTFDPTSPIQQVGDIEHPEDVSNLPQQLRHIAGRTARTLWSATPSKIKQPIRVAKWGTQGIETNGREIAENLKPFKPGMFPSGVNLYGLFTARVGISQAARLYGRAILSAEIPHSFLDLQLSTDVNLQHNERSFAQELVERPQFNTSIITINPDNLFAILNEIQGENLDYRYRIGCWVWELEDIPQEWIEAFSVFDEIWTPSKFVFNAVKKKSTVPVSYIPYCIETPIDNSCNRATFGLPQDAFLVFFMYDIGSSALRKNPGAVIDAFFEAFEKNSAGDAVLVLKARALSRGEYCMLMDRIPDPSRVIIITDDMEKPKLNALIKCCNVFVSLHRSEGFGLGIAEAMSLGVPVVTTGWSGNVDFTNEDNACLVDCQLVDIDHYYRYDIDSRWAEPNTHHAAQWLRKLHDDNDFYQKHSAAGKRYIEDNYSASAVGRLIKKRLNEIDAIKTYDVKKRNVFNSLFPPMPFERKAYPDGINLFGFFRGDLGLGQGARLYANALAKANIPNTLIDADILDYLHLNKNDTSCVDRISETPGYNINVFCVNSPEYMLEYHLFPQEFFDKRYNIGVWLWELEDLPSVWIEGFKYVDEVWVPSTYIQKTVEKVSTVPVRVIPYGIEPRIDVKRDRKSFGLPENDFLILCMYDTNSYIGRKNPEASIRAFFKAFGRHNTDAKLVLKIRDPKPEDLTQIQENLGDCDNVILFSENLSREATNSLIACCDVYISLHRSEGFGLTMAEAMYLGIPTVATNWSANTDFMNSDVACMVDFKFVSTGDDYFANNGKARWADPDSNHAAGYLKMLYEDKERYQYYATAGQNYIKEHFSIQHSGNLMQARINEILKNEFIENEE